MSPAPLLLRRVNYSLIIYRLKSWLLVILFLEMLRLPVNYLGMRSSALDGLGNRLDHLREHVILLSELLLQTIYVLLLKLIPVLDDLLDYLILL